ncbi:MAG: hypothetical protein JJE52_00020 [Acidimicrobiia bacterium]|nr:hypothetical protein [Acidimicrobiia bacterium]
MRHPEIIDFLREQGLSIIEVNGWRERGSTAFNPRGSVNHHTAGPASGNHPSLKVLINGRAGKNPLAGPLCNVSLARDGGVYLIAAGRANHAGKGSWRNLKGNSSVWGLEIEHTGVLDTEPPPSAEKLEIVHRIHAAFARCSGFDHSMVCQHFEWAPGRKIDLVSVDPEPFRSSVAERLRAPVAPSAHLTHPTDSSKDDDEMPRWIVWSAGDDGDITTYVTDTLTKQELLPGQADIMRFHGTAAYITADSPQGRELGLKDGDWLPFNWTSTQLASVPTVPPPS